MLRRITEAKMKVWAGNRKHVKGKAEMNTRKGKKLSTGELKRFYPKNEILS